MKKELELNREKLLDVQASRDGTDQRRVLIERLKDELWNAFADGGELQWIKDLQLMDLISTAYYYIRVIISLEERVLSIVYAPHGRIKNVENEIIEYLTKVDSKALQHINRAIEEIEKSLAG